MAMHPAGLAYVVCAVSDVQNRRAKGFHLLRRLPDGSEGPWHILVVRWDRKLYGHVNQCPHQEGPLDWEPDQFLDPAGTRLICGKHGALFEIATGEYVEGSCAGAALQSVRLAVMDGDICVTGVLLAEAGPSVDDLQSGSAGLS